MVTTHYITRDDLSRLFNLQQLPAHMTTRRDERDEANNSAKLYIERVKRNSAAKWVHEQHKNRKSYFEQNSIASECDIFRMNAPIDKSMLRYELVVRMWNACKTDNLLEVLSEIRLVAYEMESYDQMKCHYELIRCLMNKSCIGRQEHFGRRGDKNSVAAGFLEVIDKMWLGIHGWNH